MRTVFIVGIFTACVCLGPTAQAELITNGNFDNGLAGWSTAGDVSVAQAGPLLNLLGMQGNYAQLGLHAGTGTSSLTHAFDVHGLEQIAVGFNWFFYYRDLTESGVDEFAALVYENVFSIPITLDHLIRDSSQTGLLGDVEFGRYDTTVNLLDLPNWASTDGVITFEVKERLLNLAANSTVGIDNVAIAAVPEPCALFLLASGLAGLAGFAWRRSH